MGHAARKDFYSDGIYRCIKGGLCHLYVERKAEHWWRDAKSLLESRETEITWEVFLATFFDKYFPDSVKNDKEAEFMQLKQRSMTIGQYVAKFEELSKFSSYLKSNHDNRWKATKFE